MGRQEPFLSIALHSLPAPTRAFFLTLRLTKEEAVEKPAMLFSFETFNLIPCRKAFFFLWLP